MTKLSKIITNLEGCLHDGCGCESDVIPITLTACDLRHFELVATLTEPVDIYLISFENHYWFLERLGGQVRYIFSRLGHG